MLWIAVRVVEMIDLVLLQGGVVQEGVTKVGPASVMGIGSRWERTNVIRGRSEMRGGVT